LQEGANRLWLKKVKKWQVFGVKCETGKGKGQKAKSKGETEKGQRIRTEGQQ
jgi:hypothetical protein